MRDYWMLASQVPEGRPTREPGRSLTEALQDEPLPLLEPVELVDLNLGQRQWIVEFSIDTDGDGEADDTECELFPTREAADEFVRSVRERAP